MECVECVGFAGMLRMLLELERLAGLVLGEPGQPAELEVRSVPLVPLSVLAVLWWTPALSEVTAGLDGFLGGLHLEMAAAMTVQVERPALLPKASFCLGLEVDPAALGAPLVEEISAWQPSQPSQLQWSK